MNFQESRYPSSDKICRLYNDGATLTEYTIYDVNILREYKAKYLFVNDIVVRAPKEYSNKLIVIDMLYVEPLLRRSGIGSSIINQLTQDYNTSIILLLASPPKNEYLEKPTEHQKQEFLERINAFYTKNGFVSYNHISQYEESEPYIFIGNGIGKLIYESLI